MKFSLTYHANKENLSEAAEIRVPYAASEKILDLINDYPEADILLEFDKNNDDMPWEDIELWNKISKGKIVIEAKDLKTFETCKVYGIRYFWAYPVSTFSQLRALKDLGVLYVRLEGPLAFSMDKVQQIGVPIRIIPNIAFFDELPRNDISTGQWIRPEDLHLYEDYATIVEFALGRIDDSRKEDTLYDIYAHRHEWRSKFAYLIEGAQTDVLNRLIFSDAIDKRLNCGQRCQENNNCHICGRLFTIADQKNIIEYENSKLN